MFLDDEERPLKTMQDDRRDDARRSAPNAAIFNEDNHRFIYLTSVSTGGPPPAIIAPNGQYRPPIVGAWGPNGPPMAETRGPDGPPKSIVKGPFCPHASV
jgi:hypothetical protein